MNAPPPSEPLVRSVAIAVDEDLDEETFEALLRAGAVRPKAYLAELARAGPTQAQVNLAGNARLGLDPSPQGLTMLATFMEGIAPTWTVEWLADCAMMKPTSEAPQGP